MKVLHIVVNLSAASGVLSVIMNWYRSICGKNIIFDFLVSAKAEKIYEDEILGLGGNVYYMSDRLSVKNLKLIAKNAKAFMKENVYKYDIIHLHTHTFAYPYLYYAKKYGAKHCIVHAHSISLGNSRLKSLRNRFMIYPLKYLADHYLACSDRAGRALFNPIGIKKFDIIANGIDFEKYQYDCNKRSEMRKKLGLCPDNIAVIHISNMTDIKNTPFVVDVFNNMIKQNPYCKLFFVGKKVLPSNVCEKIEKYDVADRVTNLGIRKDVSDLLQAADICLMPSLNEGLGMVAVECQAANLPVITSDGFPDCVYVSEKIEACKLNPIAWADKSLLMVADREICTDLNLAQQSFDIKSIVQQLKAYYKRILRQ